MLRRHTQIEHDCLATLFPMQPQSNELVNTHTYAYTHIYYIESYLRITMRPALLKTFETILKTRFTQLAFNCTCNRINILLDTWICYCVHFTHPLCS